MVNVKCRTRQDTAPTLILLGDAGFYDHAACFDNCLGGSDVFGCCWGLDFPLDGVVGDLPVVE